MRAEMDYTAPLGIAHSSFLDWPEIDQDLALAWQDLRREGCPECGTKDEDWIDEKGRDLDRPRYKVVTHTCFGCRAKAEERELVDAHDPRFDWTGVSIGFDLNDESEDEA